MPVSDLFLADLKRDLTWGLVLFDDLVERWALGRPGRRPAVRRQLLECERLGIIVIEPDGLTRWTGDG